MAVRGSEEKQIIIDKILETFEGSFMNDKELRIPIGEVQIKVALTCAKDNIDAGGSVSPSSGMVSAGIANAPAEPTEKEIADVQNLLKELNL